MVVISLLRGINLGPHNRIGMDELRRLYKSLGLTDARTYIQSGNVVFRTEEGDLMRLADRIAAGIEKTFSVKSPVVLRTRSEWHEVIARNPFALEAQINPARLLVSFCSTRLGYDDLERLRTMQFNSEKLIADDREIFTYFPDGLGRSKLGTALTSKGLKVTATARNWSTVLKLEKIAGEISAG